jgi:hypothetical protein
MSNKKTTIALAAALILGSASAALAGEGSPDLSYPPGYDNVGSAPHRTAPVLLRGARGDVIENYGWAPEHGAARGFTTDEKILFDRVTGSPDHN